MTSDTALPAPDGDIDLDRPLTARDFVALTNWLVRIQKDGIEQMEILGYLNDRIGTLVELLSAEDEPDEDSDTDLYGSSFEPLD